MTKDASRGANRRVAAARSAQLAALPDGVVHSRPGSMHELMVVRERGNLRLLFGHQKREILAELDPRRPLHLVSPYTQAMMLALVWCPTPKRVHVLGLGGGRLPAVLHHHLPRVRIVCSEIDPDVPPVASEYFGLTIDARLRVVVGDGRRHLVRGTAASTLDVILVDAFRGVGSSPFELSTLEFHRICRRRMAKGAVVAMNLLRGDPLMHAKIATFVAAYRNTGFVETTHGTMVLYATEAPWPAQDALSATAERLASEHGFDFPFVDHLRSLRPLSREGVRRESRAFAFLATPPLRDAQRGRR